MNIKKEILYYYSMSPIKIKENKEIIVMSFNIRCTSKIDKKEKYYKYRAPLIKKVLETENPDIICLQEVKVKQFDYLKKILSFYDFAYAKRDNKKGGEANPIFFKKNRFTKLKSDTFWLSDTYKIMSNTFNGNCYRICTYVFLKDNKTQKDFYVFNTHLDHISEDARIKGVKLIKKVINELNVNEIPHLITGDMNDFYGSLPINELYKDYLDPSKLFHKENEPTFHDYGRDKQKIDYIAVSKNIVVNDYKVVTTTFNGVFPSDHYPIEIEIKF